MYVFYLLEITNSSCLPVQQNIPPIWNGN